MEFTTCRFPGVLWEVATTLRPCSGLWCGFLLCPRNKLYFAFFFVIHGVVQLSETFGQLCLQGLNGHVSSGENGSKTLETMNQMVLQDLTVGQWNIPGFQPKGILE